MRRSLRRIIEYKLELEINKSKGHSTISLNNTLVLLELCHRIIEKIINRKNNLSSACSSIAT